MIIPPPIPFVFPQMMNNHMVDTLLPIWVIVILGVLVVCLYGIIMSITYSILKQTK